MSNLRMNFEVDLDQGVAAYNNSMKRAEETFLQKGFCEPQIPSYTVQNGQQVLYRGELPKDLTVLSDDHLGFYMGLLTEWNAYVQFQLEKASNDVDVAKAALELTQAKLRISSKYDEDDKKRTNPEREDCMTVDQRFCAAKSLYLYHMNYHGLLKAVAFSATQSFNAVSRRITQRGQEIERAKRDGNINQSNISSNGSLFRRS